MERKEWCKVTYAEETDELPRANGKEQVKEHTQGIEAKGRGNDGKG